jgi:uncharacterized LabA/DUF88 family protein
LRAAIFIDGGYIQSQLKQNKVEADYQELADYFLEPLRHSIPLDLLRCYYYYCPPYMSPEPTEDEMKRMDAHEEFVEEIESLDRWSMRLGKLQKKWDGKKEVYEQKRVDVLLSVDLVRHAAAGHIQHAVLVAGDSDFVPAVEAAKEHGVTLSLWCGHYSTVHRDLIALADEVHVFDWEDFPLVVSPEANKSSSGNSSQQAGSQQQNRGRQRPNGGGSQKGKKNRRGPQRSQGSGQQGGQKSRNRRNNEQNKKPRERVVRPHEKPEKTTWAAKIRRFAGFED